MLTPPEKNINAVDLHFCFFFYGITSWPFLPAITCTVYAHSLCVHLLTYVHICFVICMFWSVCVCVSRLAPYAWVMYDVIKVKVISDSFHSFPYALINSAPQPLQHPQTADGALIEDYNAL